VFVTGCHRSGTSVLASLLLDVSGATLDQPDCLAPALDNPLGFFESRQLTEFNDQLLSLLGGDWAHPPLLPPRWHEPPLLDQLAAAREKFSDHALALNWIDKDPRLCITMRAMHHLFLRRIPVMVALRHPFNVAQSLYLRNGFPHERGLVLWFVYNFHLACALGHGDELVTYDQLLSLSEMVVDRDASPFNVDNPILSKMGSFLAAHGMGRPTPSVWRKAISTRIMPSLNRSNHAKLLQEFSGQVSPSLMDMVDSTYVDAKNGINPFIRAFSVIPGLILELSERYSVNAPGPLVNARMRGLEAELESTRAYASSLEREVNEIKNSKSWRLSAPFRLIADRLHHRQ